MTDSASADGVRVCATSELPDGEIRLVPAKVTGWRDDIALFNDGGEFFALDDTCTHEQASLAEGWLENGEIECPSHQSRFALRTGKVTCLPATRDACPHRVDVRDGDLWLRPGQPPVAP
ncbi:3-phenylpropionate/trans-cinnamate dioxygenase ferredoxin subunit [Allocatelliglobosispora scoriae]|uniref:3-phenylpropionate/trans-cinnamate dioxygenase ferredoxin subunit n=1 Tax=Allocatelliglobosispora scoriae TaxID=643052 RepID=A0A841BG62_9ACTN|nr:non-heme iron oxygenase ferredoxin subunit [Allocatelliglobosispora scoriae]MBB5868077.1 3-phenylpropionate/trans-cinnamate dioxygenase ferredoxin subunit [Allocatelliglobosispora scoriae]